MGGEETAIARLFDSNIPMLETVEGCNNAIHHAFDILHHVHIPKTYDLKALSTQICLPGSILCQLFERTVCSAIDFYNQLLRKAYKIYNERIDGHLLAEFVALPLQLAKLLPKMSFGDSPISP